jgi:iron complex outermembrane receptor protein
LRVDLRPILQAHAGGFVPILLASFVLAAPTAAHAQDPDETAAAPVLPPVVAVGESAAESFESEFDSTGFVEVIDTKEAWRGYETVGELLDHSVGIQVRRFGGREDLSTVSIRGSTPGQVKILLDGVNLTLASNNIVNLADLPMDSVERIEIYRGFAPVRFASSGASSVINVVTKKGTERSHGGAVTYGSFDTGKVSLFATEPVGRGSLAGTVTYRHTQGDFKFDDEGEPLDPTDDRTTRRINNDLDAVDVLLRYFLPLNSGGEFTLTNSTLYKEEGAPGRGSPQASEARVETTRTIFSAAFDGDGGSHAELNLTLAEQTLDDPTVIREDGTVDSLGFPYEEQKGRTLAVGARSSVPWSWGQFNLFETSLEPAYERFRQTYPSDLDDLPSRTEERWGLAGAVGHELWMPGINLSISTQLRHERIWNEFDTDDVFPPIDDDDVPSKDEHSTDPRVGLRWDARPDLVFKGNYGTYFRPPTFGELFGDDGFSASNPSLEPETGTNRDVGLVWSPRKFGPFVRNALEYSYFNNDIDDIIVYVSSGGRIPRPQNIGKARIRGHELRMETHTGAGFVVEANYTHQDPENRSDILDEKGNDLPGLPRDELYVRAGIDRPNWSLGWELLYQSKVYLDRVENPREAVSSKTVQNVAFSLRPPGTGFGFKIELENLTDEQFEDVVGFPRPGRAVYVSLSYSARPSSDE